MKERFKTFLLAGLILLSLYLTYALWFGSPYLEEGVLPRYEFAYFTSPPTPDTLVMPASVMLERKGIDEIHLLRRSEVKYERVWEKAYDVLKRRLPGSVEQRSSEAELKELKDDALFELTFHFNAPLPESFLWERAGLPAELHAIKLFYSGDIYYALLEGREKVLYRWIEWGESELFKLINTINLNKDTIVEKLPPHFVLQALYPEDGTEIKTSIITHLEDVNDQAEDELYDIKEQDQESIETEEGEGISRDEGEHITENGEEEEHMAENEEENIENGTDDNDTNESENKEESVEEVIGSDESGSEEDEDSIPLDEGVQNGELTDEEEIIPADVNLKHWEITVRGQIYVPAAVKATELLVAREELPENELVSAFFLDPAMARRIEERDGAIYFTDGKKGLRLYAGGSMEYTAPGLENFNDRLSYSAALLEAAENQSLYGGWPPDVFLDRSEKTNEGYRFFWRNYVRGLPLITDDSSCEMLLNEKGMPYYRRSFYTIIGKTGESHVYTNYKDVLYQSINLHLDSFPRHEATLLALEPVYRVIPEGTEGRAVPAWAVHFAETGRFYLHWQTLELL